MGTTNQDRRVTLRDVRRWAAQGERFAMLTCYDATTASWLWRGGIRCMLVGDTAARFILGHDSTLPIGVPLLVELTAAVRRGAPSALVMADMPFGSYQCGDDRALRFAARFVTDGGADVVKMELDESFAPLVQRMSSAGVPVVAHLGSRPQHKHMTGASSRTVYRDRRQVDQTIDTARRMADSGAVMILLEAVPREVSAGVVEALANHGPDGGPVPVIGCGAGPACHGHVIVLHDLMGMTDWQPPFAPPMAQVGRQIQETAAEWARQVAEGRYLEEHPYEMGR
jgi:3-methyl-2-oxobutanoate hydroxymethyltransferase